MGDVPGVPGLRGVLAARAFAAGEAVISLPTRLAIGLGLHTFTPQVSSYAQSDYDELPIKTAFDLWLAHALCPVRSHSCRQRRG